MQINYTISLSKEDLETLAEMVNSSAHSYNPNADEKRIARAICDEADVNYY